MATKTVIEEPLILGTSIPSLPTVTVTVWPPHLISVNELPEWMHKDNFILHGYRKSEPSFRRCYESLFYLHNETVNIWSHLLGAVLISSFLAWISTPALHAGYGFDPTDVAVVVFYFRCILCCLVFSVSLLSPIHAQTTGSLQAPHFLYHSILTHHPRKGALPHPQLPLPHRRQMLSQTRLSRHSPLHHIDQHVRRMVRAPLAPHRSNNLHGSERRLRKRDLLGRPRS